jgi:hypothetical protein
MAMADFWRTFHHNGKPALAGVLLGLSLAGNLVKPLLSLYGTEWRERGYGLGGALHAHPVSCTKLQCTLHLKGQVHSFTHMYPVFLPFFIFADIPATVYFTLSFVN